MKNKTIWVVDDDKIFQIIIKKVIEKSEMFSFISIFSNGKEAIEALVDAQQHNKIPDIILLDINMPIMDGWEFMEKLQLIESPLVKKIVVCISSSSIAEEDKLKAKNYSTIKHYQSKPISVDNIHMIAKSIE